MKNNRTGINLLGIAALIIALSVGYYFVIYIPNRDKLKVDSLGDLDKIEKMKLDFTDNTPQPIPEISEQEQTDFNEKFKEFLMQE